MSSFEDLKDEDSSKTYANNADNIVQLFDWIVHCCAENSTKQLTELTLDSTEAFANNSANIVDSFDWINLMDSSETFEHSDNIVKSFDWISLKAIKRFQQQLMVVLIAYEKIRRVKKPNNILKALSWSVAVFDFNSCSIYRKLAFVQVLLSIYNIWRKIKSIHEKLHSVKNLIHVLEISILFLNVVEHGMRYLSKK